MRPSPMPGGWSLCPGWGCGCWFPLCGFNLLFAGECTPCTPGWEETDTWPPSNQYQGSHLTHTGHFSSGNTHCSQPSLSFQSHHSWFGSTHHSHTGVPNCSYWENHWPYWLTPLGLDPSLIPGSSALFSHARPPELSLWAQHQVQRAMALSAIDIWPHSVQYLALQPQAYTPQPDSSSWHNFTHIHTDLTSSWHVIQLAYINMGESVNTKRESELRKDIMRKYKKTVQTAVIRYRVWPDKLLTGSIYAWLALLHLFLQFPPLFSSFSIFPCTPSWIYRALHLLHPFSQGSPWFTSNHLQSPGWSSWKWCL